MKRFLPTILIVIFSLNTFSQQISNDTITTTSIKGNWAFRVDLGAHAQSMLNQDMVDLTFSQTLSLYLYYKDIFFNVNFSSMNNDLEYYEIFIDNIDLSIGYNYDFLKFWSADTKLGVNFMNMGSGIRYYEDYEDIFFINEKLQGITTGIGLNRYFKLKRFNYLIARFGVDYYSTNYSTLYFGFGKGAINYSLTLAYKGWFRKK